MFVDINRPEIRSAVARIKSFPRISSEESEEAIGRLRSDGSNAQEIVGEIRQKSRVRDEAHHQAQLEPKKTAQSNDPAPGDIPVPDLWESPFDVVGG